MYRGNIEEVLHEHPIVPEAAVIGIAHPELEEDVGAAVAAQPKRRDRGVRAD